MLTDVNASNADDDVSTVSVADNVDQLLVNDIADSNEQLIKAEHFSSLYSEYKGEIVQDGIKLSLDNRTRS